MNLTCIVCGGALGAGRFCPGCGAEQLAPRSEKLAEEDPFIGKMIGERYEIVELINVGGMGRVYRGLHHALDRAVAIKVIHPHLSTAEEISSRFMMEAQTASRLNHPNVVSIYDFGRTSPVAGNHLFMVMELLLGRDLATVIQSGIPMPLRRVSDVLSQTLGALAEAHHLGITHRDVKPENIILEARRSGGDLVKVIDFGIAKLGRGTGLTQIGQVVGTPYYMAPEQATAKEVGPSADLYAVGVMLFEMLTGQLLFDGPTPNAVMLQHLAPERPDPRQVAPKRNIPDGLAEVCLRAIDVDPAKRFPTAEELARAIFSASTPAGWTVRRAALFPSSSSRVLEPPVSSKQFASNPPSRGRISARPPAPSTRPAAPSSPPPAPSRGSNRSTAPSPQVPGHPRSSSRSSALFPQNPEVPATSYHPAPASRITNRGFAATAPAWAASLPDDHGSAPPPRPSEADTSAIKVPSLSADPHEPRTTAPPSVPPISQGNPASSRFISDVAPLHATPEIASFPERIDLPLMGRAGDLAWAREALADPKSCTVAFWGRPGTGRTRLLLEVASEAARTGALVVHLHAPPPPQGEVSYSGLRRLITRLVGQPASNPLLASGAGATTLIEADGLRAIFGGGRASWPAALLAGPGRGSAHDTPGHGSSSHQAEPSPPTPSVGAYSSALSPARRAACAALCWAARLAIDSTAGFVLLAVDNIDHLDWISRVAIADMLARNRPPRFGIITTGESAPEDWTLAGGRSRAIAGLAPDDVMALLRDREGLVRALELSGWIPIEVEPLYVDQLLRWYAEETVHQAPPAKLAHLMEWRIRGLPAAQRRALQTVAVHGAGSTAILMAAAARPEEFEGAAAALIDAGMLEWDPTVEEVLRLSHPMLGAIALNVAPRGAVAELHTRAAESLVGAPLSVELQAYHALRGRPDLESFMLVEESARLRQQIGDEDGVIATLGEGLRAARAGVLRGEAESTSGLVVFGHKLGTALVHVDRLDEAMGVLTETLDIVGPHDIERALILEQLAIVAESRSRHSEGESRRREAIGIAERLGNRELVDRLRRSSARPTTGPRTLQDGTYGLDGGGSGVRGKTARSADDR
jgi:serine/threonine-protein kinase